MKNSTPLNGFPVWGGAKSFASSIVGDRKLESCPLPDKRLLNYTVFESVRAKPRPLTGSWEKLLSIIQSTDGYPDKRSLPLLSFADYGDTPTTKGSLRHDDNVTDLYGVIGDYDGEVLSIEEAESLLKDAGVSCALYPSPSYTASNPRWRVVAPFYNTAEGSPSELRATYGRMVSRLNGVLGGVLAKESWTLSQSYYFGKTDTAERYEVIRVPGQHIDVRSDLDATAIGAKCGASPARLPEAVSAGVIAEKALALGRRLRKGDERRALLMSYIGAEVNRGTSPDSIKLQVIGLAAKHFEQDGDFNEDNINRIVDDFVANADSDWGEPIPLSDDLPTVQKFDLSLMPEALRAWVADIAERMQISPDIPAVGAITALSSAIGRRVKVRPKVYDQSWEVVPNLWGAVVAPPGYMKSPALASVMAPLDRLERQAHKEFEQALVQHEAEAMRVELANSAAKSVALAVLKKDPNAKIAPPSAAPEPPALTRYVVHNFSIEALAEVLITNTNGVLTFNDELYGLLMMADRPGNEELHAFLLQAWNGNGGFSFDRIGRGHRYVDYVCVSLLGGIQPGRLLTYLESSANGGAADSGFIQRFQLLTWPDLPDDWALIDRGADLDAEQKAFAVFERVTSLGKGLFADIRQFQPDAQAAFYKWLESNERECRSDSVSDVMRSHLSKYRSLVPSLALIFALADGVEGDIPLQYVEQAVGWAGYLRSHAERVFHCTTNSEPRRARALLAKIKDGKLGSEFKAADVYMKGWSALSDVANVEKATDMLCDLGYLKRVERKSGDRLGRGRASITFKVNPMVMQERATI